MNASLPFRLLVTATLLAVMAAATPIARAAPRRMAKPIPVARAVPESVSTRVVVSCDALEDGPLDQPPVLRSSVAPNYTNHMLEQPRDGVVGMCLLVDSTGTVREAGLTGPETPFDAAALEAVRWWVFTPAMRAGRAVPARIAVKLEARVPRDADLLVPDILALALDAEQRGSVREALDAYTGAVMRVGTHPAIQNEWVLREHVVRLAARLPKPPEVPMLTEATARGQHNIMLRNLARVINEDCARALDEVLRTSPWYADAYRWRASARAASGQRDGAVRDVLCYRLTVRDSASLAVAERALVALASADTVAALMMLKN